MRNISFALTTEQIRNRSKTVARRPGWENLKPGTLLLAVKKGMGLKPGEKIEPLAVIRVVSVRREMLSLITRDDCEREGFPELRPEDFIDMFKSHMGGMACQMVTRIEFEYVAEEGAPKS